MKLVLSSLSPVTFCKLLLQPTMPGETDASTITGLAAGKLSLWMAIEEGNQIAFNSDSDPSSNLMNYVKFTLVAAASISKIKRFCRVKKLS